MWEGEGGWWAGGPSLYVQVGFETMYSDIQVEATYRIRFDEIYYIGRHFFYQILRLNST